MNDGTFGVTGEAGQLDDEVAEAIMQSPLHPDPQAAMAQCRVCSSAPCDALIASLEAGTDDEWLTRAREADDLAALKTLSEIAEVRMRATGRAGR